MQRQLIACISVAALLSSACARSDDPTPGAVTDASVTAAVKTEMLVASFTPALCASPAPWAACAPSRTSSTSTRTSKVFLM